MKYIISLSVCLLASVNLYAHSCAQKKHTISTEKTTSTAPEQDFYDVKYVKYDLELTNLSTAITGHVTTKALVTVSSLSIYAFELHPELTVDSFKMNGQITPLPMASATNPSVRLVTLPGIAQNNVFTAEVFYHGQPTSGTGFFTRGLNYVKLASGTQIMYTMSDMYTADDWWPCKQNITDKIDSTDMWVTVADSLKAGSNGLLKAVTPLGNNKRRFEWKTQYPIDYYLISVAVGVYGDYSYNMQFTDGSGDQMLIQNYVYDSAAYMTPARKAALDSTGYIVDHFSKLFGKYPFYKEKYGHCIAEPLGGGMEHQTMTTLAFAQTTLIAHELGHQWWGDCVTYGSWSDIWLSEGFATYAEHLFVEHFRGDAAAKAYRGTRYFNEAMKGPGGTVYVSDTNDVNDVFSPRLTYAKGAAVAHMLRYLAPQDDLYFTALQQYQQQFRFGNAVTPDLKAIAAQVYGQNLDTFFSQWIYREGYPTYSAKWYQSGGQVYLQLNQATSKPASVVTFHMPVELKLQSAAGDTVIKVFNDQSSQTYTLSWGKTMTGMSIDPNDHIMNKTGAITNDPKLGVEQVPLKNLAIYPNPATEGWYVQHLPAGTALMLTDISGAQVWKGQASAGEVYIPAKYLAAGTYILTVSGKGSGTSYVLVK